MSYFITKDAVIHDSIDLFHFLLDLPLMSALIEFMDKYWDFCHGNIVSIFDVYQNTLFLIIISL